MIYWIHMHALSIELTIALTYIILMERIPK